MQPFHIYPDALMKQLPDYVGDDAPAIALSEHQCQIVTQMLEQCFAYCRDQEGMMFLTLQDVFPMVAGSLLQAGVSTEDMKRIMDFGTQWFINHPNGWATTTNSETGRVWLASLRIPTHL